MYAIKVNVEDTINVDVSILVMLYVLLIYQSLVNSHTHTHTHTHTYIYIKYVYMHCIQVLVEDHFKGDPRLDETYDIPHIHITHISKAVSIYFYMF